MTTPPAAPKGVARPRTNWRVLLALAAIVAMIFVGLGAFDQLVSSVAVYLHLPGADLTTITAGPLPRDYWTRFVLNIFLVLLFLFLVPVRVKGSWQAHGTYAGFMVSLFAEMYGFPLTVYFLASVGYASEPGFVRYVFLYGQVVGSPIVIAEPSPCGACTTNHWGKLAITAPATQRSHAIYPYGRRFISPPLRLQFMLSPPACSPIGRTSTSLR